MDETSAARAYRAYLVSKRQQIDIAINAMDALNRPPGKTPTNADFEHDGATKTIGAMVDPTALQVDAHGQPKMHKTLDRFKLKTGPKPKSQHNSTQNQKGQPPTHSN